LNLGGWTTFVWLDLTVVFVGILYWGGYRERERQTDRESAHLPDSVRSVYDTRIGRETGRGVRMSGGLGRTVQRACRFLS